MSQQTNRTQPKTHDPSHPHTILPHHRNKHSHHNNKIFISRTNATIQPLTSPTPTHIERKTTQNTYNRNINNKYNPHIFPQHIQKKAAKSTTATARTSHNFRNWNAHRTKASVTQKGRKSTEIPFPHCVRLDYNFLLSERALDPCPELALLTSPGNAARGGGCGTSTRASKSDPRIPDVTRIHILIGCYTSSRLLRPLRHGEDPLRIFTLHI